jgi:phosphatidylserine decarboxylase
VIARGAPPLILFAPLVAMAGIAAAVLVLERMVLTLLTIPFGLAFLGILFFFRDPEREIGPGIVSPADGRVLSVDPATRSVSIFMGVADVHVNRAPLAGVVAGQDHRPGGHAVASRPEAARNERLAWDLETRLGSLRLTQVAGAFARRIVPYVHAGDKVKKGQRIGLVRFGSRVDLVLPPGCRPTVAAGDRVRAGTSTIAEVSDGLGLGP